MADDIHGRATSWLGIRDPVDKTSVSFSPNLTPSIPIPCPFLTLTLTLTPQTHQGTEARRTPSQKPTQEKFAWIKGSISHVVFPNEDPTTSIYPSQAISAVALPDPIMPSINPSRLPQPRKHSRPFD
ncbi:hypothetical protein EYC84_007013 [Monilinia fructicola]|uniref:Uncharacterized protein n=1 Tax=Monilinia fructicola TaxID=38448 RepID=A0A5M9K902_MONFR|nr:hypothetical protein EYC84_007013 [Monilinia fructicola]